ncbi:MAG TPA: TonB-dependent receptor [Kofleriaceae bacterium]|nr:TonB-dependent receptor [Kofleriaceae bacterium]
MNQAAAALLISCASCALAVTGAAAAWADDAPATGDGDAPAPGEIIVIEGRAPGAARDRERALGEAPFLTVLHPDEHPATASVADALGTAAGAQTRSLGGLGAYASVSVRGQAPGHTAVLIDGVPLARLAEVTTDLGRYALDAFGEVELYRGAVPIELGGAGAGGAVNLVTRLGRGERGERLRASIGAGSYGARHARLRYGDDHGGVLSSVMLGYQGASGDYTYFTDSGTPLNPDDDDTLVRANNHFDQLELAARAGSPDRARGGGLRLTWKRQGLPGSIAQPAQDASLATAGALADARATSRLGAAAARHQGYALVERQVLRDPAGELGLGAQDRGYLTLAAGASTVWAIARGCHRGTAGLELRGERFRDADRGGARATLVGTRAAGAASLAAELALGAAIVVSPAVRLEVVRTAPTPVAEGPDALAAVPPRWDALGSPRLTARARLAADLAVKGSAGRYVRLPTLLELFGDRGTIHGSPGLLPERGTSADTGLVWAPARARRTAAGELDQILVEAAAFATRAADTIALISTAGFAARAENIGGTQTYGGELVLAARLWRTLAVTASYTRLVTEQRALDANFAGKALPRTPGHLAYARAELARRRFALWADAALQSTAYLDPANFQRVPARALVGAGARVPLAAGFAAALAVSNLTGVRVVTIPPDRPIDAPTPTALADLAGFPLPGRSFYLSLDWTH